MESIGDVICGLDELLLVAAERWRTPLTQQELARISGLSRSTINELLPRRVQAHALGGAAAETELVPYQGRIALRERLASLDQGREQAALEVGHRQVRGAVDFADVEDGAEVGVQLLPSINGSPSRVEGRPS